MSKSQKLNTNWKLDHLLSDTSEKNIQKLKEKLDQEATSFQTKWENNKEYLTDPIILKAALDEYELMSRGGNEEDNLGYFFWLKSCLDTTDPKIKAINNDLSNFGNKLIDKTRFFELNIAKIPLQKQKEFLASEKLSKYKHFLEEIFRESKHVLSQEEEKIVNRLATPAYSNWNQMVEEFLSKEQATVLDHEGNKIKKTLPEISGLIIDQNKEIRDTAAKAMHKITKKYSEVATAELNSILQFKKDMDELRNYSRPDESRFISDDIDATFIDTLVETVSKRFEISHKFYEIKAKLLGQDKLEYHERAVEYGALSKEYTFEEAVEIIAGTFNNLDSEFEQIFLEFVKNGHIDVYPQKGKVGGAFCVHNQITQPVYILLNYTNKLNDVLTIAHEMGHAIHNEFMRKKQHALYFDNSKATAEVASTFMEDFVLQNLLKTATKEEQLAILVQKATDETASIQAQVAFYMFEQEMHKQFAQKSYLSTNELSKMFANFVDKYAGKYVKPIKGNNYRWVAFSHIRNFFYVYSYASGLLISKSLQNSTKQNPDFIKKVKEFFETGSSLSPKDTFLHLGINIYDKQFWKKGLDEQETLINSVETLAKELGKI